MAIADTDMSLIGPRMYRNAACACRNSNGGKFDWRRGRRVARVPNQGDFVQINAENRHGDTRVTLSNNWIQWYVLQRHLAFIGLTHSVACGRGRHEIDDAHARDHLTKDRVSRFERCPVKSRIVALVDEKLAASGIRVAGPCHSQGTRSLCSRFLDSLMTLRSVFFCLGRHQSRRLEP